MFFENGDGEIGLFLVEGLDFVGGELLQFAAFDKRGGDGGTEAGGGEVGDGVQAADGFYHFGGGDDDAGAHAGQAGFGQAEAEDDIVVPVETGGDVDDVGEGQAVGVVDDKGDVVGAGELVEACHFAVGEDVAAGVGGAGAADGTDLAVLQFGQVFEGGEVDAVFEEAVLPLVFGAFDLRRDGDEAGRVDVGVGIADVFGGEGQEDGFVAAVVEWAAEQVEEIEEGVLRTVGEGDVFFANVPAVLAAEVGGEGGDQAGVALGGGVVGQAFDGGAVVGDLAQGVGKGLLHGGNVGGVAAAEHIDGFAFRQGAAEVVHQLQDTAVAGEFLAESGELHGWAFVGWLRRIIARAADAKAA